MSSSLNAQSLSAEACSGRKVNVEYGLVPESDSPRREPKVSPPGSRAGNLSGAIPTPLRARVSLI